MVYLQSSIDHNAHNKSIPIMTCLLIENKHVASYWRKNIYHYESVLDIIKSLNNICKFLAIIYRLKQWDLRVLVVNLYKPTQQAYGDETTSNGGDTDQVPQNMTSDQCLTCLLTEYSIKI